MTRILVRRDGRRGPSNLWTVLAFFAIVPPAARSAEHEFLVTVAAGKHDRTNSPVTARVVLPAEFEKATVAGVATLDGKTALGSAQLAEPALLDDRRKARNERIVRNVHFILPRPLKGGQTATYRVTISRDASSSHASFAWHETRGESAELRYGDRPVLRYMYRPLDETSKATREQTYKVYHHLFSPDGEQLVTKGPGGQYTHHRGLFYGFNRVSYDEGKSKADVWHCTGDAHQSHQGVLAAEAGPVLGRHLVKVHWHGPGKRVFAEELRELTAYRVPGGHLVEFASRLVSKAGTTVLDGDPQHAGFHFRASNEVAEKTKGQTYFLRPDGPGKPGETRNWDHKSRDRRSVNLPWNGMSFVVGGQRYTAAYLDKPTNPKEARYSERDYGRFGSYFEYQLAEGKTLDVNYRLWLQEGEMKVEDVQRLITDFVEPPSVTVSAATR